MIRLKKILNEQNNKKEEAKKLNSILDDFRIDIPELLYRSTTTDFDGYYEVKELKNKRKPIGPSLAQWFIDFRAEYVYENVPKRSRSKFASSEDKIGYFGENEYIIFPDNNADIVSFSKDTLTYRNELKKALRFVPKFVNTHDFLEYETLLDFYNVISLNRTYKKFVEFLKNNWDHLKEELKKLKNEEVEEIGGDKVKKDLNEKIDEILNPTYFQNMEMGIEPNSGEVVFDGSMYLYVQPTFFKEFFEWNGNKWELKNEA